MKKSDSKILGFMRRNAIYLILSLCIIAVGVSITLMLLSKEPQIEGSVTPPVNDTPVVVDPIPDGTDEPVINVPDDTIVNVEPVDVPVTFIMPVKNPTSVGEYSETMVFNSTLGRFSSHMAIDFFAEEGTDVLCVYGGTVTSVDTTLLKGTTVTIDHGNGLKTVYNSLEDGEDVFIGQKVEQGDVIGYVSTSNKQEYKEGAHLHFSVIENGEVIDPSKYLTINEK